MAFVQTQQQLAEEFSVSRRTINDWKARKGFPAKRKEGWDLDEIREWVRREGLGNRNGQAKSIDGVTLTEANIRRTIEQAENERIKKERQLVEQAIELGEIVRISDVRHLYLQTQATVTAIQDALPDAIDRAMPESPPDADAWPEIRQRVMDLCRKLQPDTAAAMEGLLTR